MDILLSVVVPIYKAEEHIVRCVQSLMSQTYDNLELIFIDDQGLDNSWSLLQDVLKGYEATAKTVKLVQHEVNRGAAAARNTGLQHATGTYLTFCDADDWIEPNGYEEMLRFTVERHAEVIWCDFYYDFTHSLRLQKEEAVPDATSCVRALITERMHGSLCNKLYLRALFSNHNIVFDEKADVWEDLFVNVKAFSLAERIAYLPQAFYHYVQGKTDSLSSASNPHRIEQMMNNVTNIETFLKDKEEFDMDLHILKLAAKQTLLFESDMDYFKRWRAVYPESNPYIWHFSALPFHIRMLGWCVKERLWLLVKGWLVIKSLKKSFTR